MKTENTQGLYVGMPLRMRSKTHFEQMPRSSLGMNTFLSFKNQFLGKTAYLLGWAVAVDGHIQCYSVVMKLGDYHPHNISGHPFYLFEQLSIPLKCHVCGSVHQGPGGSK